MKTVLVTGGAGFIGSHFVRYMTEKYAHWQFVTLDALTYAADKGFEDSIETDNHLFIQADITDSEALEEVFASFDFDIVVNFAAQTDVDNSISSPDVFVHTNVYGTQCLLSAAKKAWDTTEAGGSVPVFNESKLFLQISTDEVYGSIENGSADESAPLNPSSPYAASKASADHLVRSFIKTYGFPAIITRSSNNFGPNQFPEKLIPVVINCAVNDMPIPVYGDGMQKRDWLYVQDNVTAIETVIKHGKIGEVYNIGSQKRRTNLEIVKRILKELEKPESLISLVSDRPGHDRRYAVDTGKIQEIGWKLAHEFEEALKTTVEWYKSRQ